MDFIDRIEKLLAENKISKKKFLADLDMNKNTFSAWRDRGTIPGADVLLQIANYFETTIDYLLTGKSPATGEGDGLAEDIKEINSILDVLGPDERKEVLKYAKFQASEQKQ